jgi:hypothetical protein
MMNVKKEDFKRRKIMIWKLKDLIDSVNSTQAEINGKWVPARPINYKCRSFSEKIKDAWAVFSGKAEAFYWPEGQ